MFAQVKMFLRTVSVAFRVPGRESSRGHGHIADSVAALGWHTTSFMQVDGYVEGAGRSVL